MQAYEDVIHHRGTNSRIVLEDMSALEMGVRGDKMPRKPWDAVIIIQ